MAARFFVRVADFGGGAVDGNLDGDEGCEVAEVGARHQEADDLTIEARGERHADRGVVECLGQLVVDVRAAVAAGDAAVDADDVGEVGARHRAHVRAVARQQRGVVVGLQAVVDLAVGVAGRVLRIALQLAKALQGAAAHGMVHRNITPHNLLIRAADDVVNPEGGGGGLETLLDFNGGPYEVVENGNAFLIVSGLLNLLVALDAYDVAMGRK